jgi:hypothetical protein
MKGIVPAAGGSGWCAAVAGSGVVRLGRDELERFRRRPGPIPTGWTVPQPLRLRQSDDQTLAALGAIYQAAAGIGCCNGASYRDWGVVAAPRYLGRGVLAGVLRRFGAEGVWGVTPHLIPHHALHAQSGTLSQALGIHGPNLGVGGGADAVVQGFVMALTWLGGRTVPGVWLVASAWTPEYIPDGAGAPIGEPEVVAIALALVPVGTNIQQRGLPHVRVDILPGDDAARSEMINLTELAACFGSGARGDDAGRPLAGGPGKWVRTSAATFRIDPGHGAPGRASRVIAATDGIRIELEPATLARRRRSG